MVTSPFNPNDDKYKCCCNSCLSTTGVKILMILNIISLVFSALSLFTDEGGSNIFSMLVNLGVTICLYMALRTEKPGWLIPQLVVCVLGMIACVILALVCASVGLFGEQVVKEAIENDPEMNEMMQHIDAANLPLFGCIMALVFLAFGLYCLWIFTCIKSAYNFYRDQEAYRLITPAVPMQQQQAYYAAAGPQAPPPYTEAPYPQK